MNLGNRQLVFVGSYGPETESTIEALAFDPVTGELTLLESFTGIANPSFLVLHPNGRSLYAVSEVALAGEGRHGALYAFALGERGVGIRPKNHHSTNGDWPCHVVLDQTGKWAVASNYGSGSAALFQISAENTLSEAHAIVQHSGSGPNAARQEGPHAHSATFSPDNHYLLVADLGIDQLVIYRFDAVTGALSKHGSAQTQPGAGPRHFAWHPSGELLYVANELANSVGVYRYGADDGTLEPVQTLSTLPAPDPTSGVADIHLSPAGTHLYISNRGHNSIATFAVAADGSLTMIGTASCGGNWPRNFAVAPNGRFMLVANRRSNGIAVLPVSEDGSEIGDAVHQYTIAEPSCIQFFM